MRGILALFIRSVRENIRGASFAWMRAGMAVAVLLTMFFYKALNTVGAVGMQFFQPFAIYNAIMIMVAATSYFASAITEEKEEQTLGMLRMTNLSVLAILFGKSTSRFFSGIMMLGVQLPFALLAVTLGGITWEQVAIVYALLCGFLFFASNLGLLASVVASTGARAGVLTVFLGSWYLIPSWPVYFVAFFVRFVSEDAASALDSFANDLGEHSGPAAFFEALDIGWTAAAWKETVVGFVVAGGLSFLLSWALFSRFARDESDAASRPEKRGRLRTKTSRAGRAWVDGVAWKDFHFLYGGWRTFIVKSVIYVLFFGYIIAESQRYEYRLERALWPCFGYSLIALFFEVVFGASKLLRAEVRAQTLGGLYVLPSEVPALLRSKRNALLLSRMPILAVFTLSLLLAVLEFLKGFSGDGEGIFVALQVIVIAPLEFIFHYRLVVWFSMRLKWGGLPGALITSFFGHVFGVTILALAAKEASGIPMIMILGGLIAALGGANRRMIVKNAALG